jgi:hypothetical protein
MLELLDKNSIVGRGSLSKEVIEVEFTDKTIEKINSISSNSTINSNNSRYQNPFSFEAIKSEFLETSGLSKLITTLDSVSVNIDTYKSMLSNPISAFTDFVSKKVMDPLTNTVSNTTYNNPTSNSTSIITNTLTPIKETISKTTNTVTELASGMVSGGKSLVDNSKGLGNGLTSNAVGSISSILSPKKRKGNKTTNSKTNNKFSSEYFSNIKKEKEETQYRDSVLNFIEDSRGSDSVLQDIQKDIQEIKSKVGGSFFTDLIAGALTGAVGTALMAKLLGKGDFFSTLKDSLNPFNKTNGVPCCDSTCVSGDSKDKRKKKNSKNRRSILSRNTGLTNIPNSPDNRDLNLRDTEVNRTNVRSNNVSNIGDINAPNTTTSTIKGGLRSIGKGVTSLGKGVPVIGTIAGVGMGAYSFATSESDEERKDIIGEAGGGAAGATVGAAIGTMIFPGVGTVIGAGVGGLLGSEVGKGIMDLFKSPDDSIPDDIKEDPKKLFTYIRTVTAPQIVNSPDLTNEQKIEALQELKEWKDSYIEDNYKDKVDEHLDLMGDKYGTLNEFNSNLRTEFSDYLLLGDMNLVNYINAKAEEFAQDEYSERLFGLNDESIKIKKLTIDEKTKDNTETKLKSNIDIPPILNSKVTQDIKDKSEVEHSKIENAEVNNIDEINTSTKELKKLPIEHLSSGVKVFGTYLTNAEFLGMQKQLKLPETPLDKKEFLKFHSKITTYYLEAVLPNRHPNNEDKTSNMPKTPESKLNITDSKIENKEVKLQSLTQVQELVTPNTNIGDLTNIPKNEVSNNKNNGQDSLGKEISAKPLLPTKNITNSLVTENSQNITNNVLNTSNEINMDSNSNTTIGSAKKEQEILKINKEIDIRNIDEINNVFKYIIDNKLKNETTNKILKNFINNSEKYKSKLLESETFEDYTDALQMIPSLEVQRQLAYKLAPEKEGSIASIIQEPETPIQNLAVPKIDELDSKLINSQTTSVEYPEVSKQDNIKEDKSILDITKDSVSNFFGFGENINTTKMSEGSNLEDKSMLDRVKSIGTMVGKLTPAGQMVNFVSSLFNSSTPTEDAQVVDELRDKDLNKIDRIVGTYDYIINTTPNKIGNNQDMISNMTNFIHKSEDYKKSLISVDGNIDEYTKVLNSISNLKEHNDLAISLIPENEYSKIVNFGKSELIKPQETKLNIPELTESNSINNIESIPKINESNNTLAQSSLVQEDTVTKDTPILNDITNGISSFFGSNDINNTMDRLGSLPSLLDINKTNELTTIGNTISTLLNPNIDSAVDNMKSNSINILGDTTSSNSQGSIIVDRPKLIRLKDDAYFESHKSKDKSQETKVETPNKNIIIPGIDIPELNSKSSNAETTEIIVAANEQYNDKIERENKKVSDEIRVGNEKMQTIIIDNSRKMSGITPLNAPDNSLANETDTLFQKEKGYLEDLSIFGLMSGIANRG